MPIRPFRSAALVATTLASLAGGLGAQTPRLGTIVFPTSGPAAAQEQFLRGVLYMHSFEYAQAAAAFHRAQEIAPDFAMAYWGEAMTHTHPLWNEQNLEAARAVLARLAPTRAARLARAPTPRERAWLEATEVLYGDGPKARRDTLYAQTMERLLAAHADDEAETFTALALMGLSQSVRDIPTYMRAAVLADEVFRSNPDHPGAAHYVIHAFDDPIHAPLGLRAARAYSGIAPDAAHAQHMTTHIFLALGLWDDVVSQNNVAVRATAWVPGHYSHWLVYGEIQRGRWAEARRVLETVHGNIQPDRQRQRTELAFMRAHYLLATDDWSGPVARWTWEIPAGSLAARVDVFTRGYGAWRAGNRPGIERALTELGAPDGDPIQRRKHGILERQLRALAQLEAGVTDEAVRLVREAAAQEDSLPMEFGPPDVVKPSHELLGEVLLRAGRAADAQRAFSRALELAPGRSRALAGLVRAAAAAGDHEVARAAFARLESNYRLADPAVRELAELRTLVVAGR